MTLRAVCVAMCVQMMMNEFLPRMDKGNATEFRTMLKADTEASGVIESYSDKIKEWLDKVCGRAKDNG